jgi:hypothetical protein
MQNSSTPFLIWLCVLSIFIALLFFVPSRGLRQGFQYKGMVLFSIMQYQLLFFFMVPGAGQEKAPPILVGEASFVIDS